MDFRKDINGLRAVAVLVVVLFHFGVPGMQGGFVGVDVFFVISGYLMTGIIFSGLQKGSFSILEFYIDRARRIIPALACVCVFVLLAGGVMLIPEHYEDLGRHVLGSLAFVSNFIYSQESGYFEHAAHEKWLLHTWSLSIEWQFYFMYPLVIVIINKFISLEKIRWLILLAALLSFTLSVYASSRWPVSAFYLLPTRAWEMLVGALIYLFPMRAISGYGRSLELLGVGLIAVGTIFFSSQLYWPGWLASLPVVGAALIIMQERRESFLTGNPVSQFLGKTSYSIYLWHWPLVVWINYFGLGNYVLWVGVAIAASVLMGYLSYNFVENMTRKRGRTQKRKSNPSSIANVAPTVIAVIFGVAIILSNGFPKRMNEEYYAVLDKLELPRVTNGWCFYDVNGNENIAVGSEGVECILGERNSDFKGLLFGDSFAGHYGPFWDEIGKDFSAKINSVSTNWCYPSKNDVIYGDYNSRSYDQCLVNRDYFERNVSDYDFAVLSGSWRNIHLANKMQGVYDAISHAAKKTELVIVMAAPTYFDVNVRYVYVRSVLFDLGFDINRFSKNSDMAAVEANQLLEKFTRKYSNVFFLNRDEIFHVNGLPSDVTQENIPYSFDQFGHISIYGSIMASKSFKQSNSYYELDSKLKKIRSRKRFELTLKKELEPIAPVSDAPWKKPVPLPYAL